MKLEYKIANMRKRNQNELYIYKYIIIKLYFIFICELDIYYQEAEYQKKYICIKNPPKSEYL